MGHIYGIINLPPVQAKRRPKSNSVGDATGDKRAPSISRWQTIWECQQCTSLESWQNPENMTTLCAFWARDLSEEATNF